MLEVCSYKASCQEIFYVAKALEGRKEIFYLWLYSVGHMVKDHSDSERENPLPPYGLLFPISSKGYFTCTIPSWCDGSSDRSFMVDPLSYFSFQPVFHSYPASGMVHIKEPLLLIEMSSLCGGSGLPLTLSEWSFTICLTPASLNKTFLPSFRSI